MDELIAVQPQRLEFYRTRGIVHCFRDEYPQATKDFTYALKEARAIRKAKMVHRYNGSQSDARSHKGGKKRKGTLNNSHTNGQAPPDGTSALASDNTVEGPDGEPLVLHYSVLADAPDPIEPQLLFLRGAAYLQQAVFLVEAAVLKLEGIRKVASVDGAELRLCYIENGKYGGVEMGNPDGPLGKKNGEKVLAYRQVLADEEFKEQIVNLLKKSIRDHERFLVHFDTLESAHSIPDGDLAQQTEYAFLLSESIRPGNHNNAPPLTSEVPMMFTTYHPLLVESHFSVLICQLMLGDFVSILPTFARTASLVDGLEGYPVFLPPRSMGQAEFIEVLERLASGWRTGTYPHSLSPLRGKGRLAIEAPPPCFSPPIPTKSNMLPCDDHASHASSSSSSSSSPRLNGLQDECRCSTTQLQYPPDDAGAAPSNGFHRPPRADAVEALDCARILLAPVVSRQREKAEKAAAEKAAGANKKKSMPINIPLHGPRVEVILAWLGAVHLPELDA